MCGERVELRARAQSLEMDPEQQASSSAAGLARLPSSEMGSDSSLSTEYAHDAAGSARSSSFRSDVGSEPRSPSRGPEEEAAAKASKRKIERPSPRREFVEKGKEEVKRAEVVAGKGNAEEEEVKRAEVVAGKGNAEEEEVKTAEVGAGKEDAEKEEVKTAEVGAGKEDAEKEEVKTAEGGDEEVNEREEERKGEGEGEKKEKTKMEKARKFAQDKARDKAKDKAKSYAKDQGKAAVGAGGDGKDGSGAGTGTGTGTDHLRPPQLVDMNKVGDDWAEKCPCCGKCLSCCQNVVGNTLLGVLCGPCMLIQMCVQCLCCFAPQFLAQKGKSTASTVSTKTRATAQSVKNSLKGGRRKGVGSDGPSMNREHFDLEDPEDRVGDEDPISPKAADALGEGDGDGDGDGGGDGDGVASAVASKLPGAGEVKEKEEKKGAEEGEAAGKEKDESVFEGDGLRNTFFPSPQADENRSGGGNGGGR